MVNMSPHDAYHKTRNMKLQNIPYKSKSQLKKIEKVISQDEFYSYYYAIDILNGPFLLCHHIIFNSNYRKQYLDFLKSLNYNMKEIYDQYGEFLI